MPLPAKLLKVPPVAETSVEIKSVAVSLKVNARLAVSPAFRADCADVMAMVGNTVSTVNVLVLLASDPSLLLLPAASLKVPLATLTTPLVVLLAVGVKVAV